MTTPSTSEQSELQPCPTVEPCAHCGVKAKVVRTPSDRCWAALLIHKDDCVWLTWIGDGTQVILERGFNAWNTRSRAAALSRSPAATPSLPSVAPIGETPSLQDLAIEAAEFLENVAHMADTNAVRQGGYIAFALRECVKTSRVAYADGYKDGFRQGKQSRAEGDKK